MRIILAAAVLAVILGCAKPPAEECPPFGNAQLGAEPGSPNWDERLDYDGDGFLSTVDFRTHLDRCGG